MRCEPRLRPHSNSDGRFEEIGWLFRPDFAAGVGEKTVKTFGISFALLLALLASLLMGACSPVVGPTVSSPEAAEEPAADNSVTSRLVEETVLFPIDVDYYTPAQTEGPFYPVRKPEDRDSDLFVLDGAAGRPSGDILEFGGRLYDSSGMPVQGAVIEIWQTDVNGVYMHPGDFGSSRRDVNFQSYGESVTGEDGFYHFRTIMPGGYEPRPRHIHVKVRLTGKELLTTQFYFSNDPEAAGDSIFAGAGAEVSALIMEVEAGVDFEGNPALIGRRDIILRIDIAE